MQMVEEFLIDIRSEKQIKQLLKIIYSCEHVQGILQKRWLDIADDSRIPNGFPVKKSSCFCLLKYLSSCGNVPYVKSGIIKYANMKMQMVAEFFHNSWRIPNGIPIGKAFVLLKLILYVFVSTGG